MQTVALAQLDRRMATVSLGRCSDEELCDLVRALNHGRRVIDGHLARIATEAGRREEIGSGPVVDDLFRRGGDVSRDEAERQADRGRVSADLPKTAERMHTGHLLTENMDTVARSTKRLTSAERSRLAALDGEIAGRAGALPPETFGRWFRKLVRSVVDDDVPSTAERQKAASRLTLGRRRNGMWWIAGEFDQERGAELDAMVRRTARRLAGSEAPTDNTRATALHRLATGRSTALADPPPSSSIDGPSSGQSHASTSHGSCNSPGGRVAPSDTAHTAGHAPRAAGGNVGRTVSGGDSTQRPTGVDSGPTVSGGGRGTLAPLEGAGCGGGCTATLGIGYIVDAETLVLGPHAGSMAQTWAGDDYDPRAVQRLACDADRYAVMVGRLGRPDAVGRTSRAASREQRLALRSLYRCCPLDGTPFDRCEIHHVNVPFELGGPTVLDNLVPISSEWHHRVHDRGWTLTMASDRALTLQRPNGTLDRVVPPPRPVTRQRE